MKNLKNFLYVIGLVVSVVGGILVQVGINRNLISHSFSQGETFFFSTTAVGLMLVSFLTVRKMIDKLFNIEESRWSEVIYSIDNLIKIFLAVTAFTWFGYLYTYL